MRMDRLNQALKSHARPMVMTLLKPRTGRACTARHGRHRSRRFHQHPFDSSCKRCSSCARYRSQSTSLPNHPRNTPFLPGYTGSKLVAVRRSQFRTAKANQERDRNYLIDAERSIQLSLERGISVHQPNHHSQRLIGSARPIGHCRARF